MSASNADRNLLFGIVALQMDFINRDALIEAMNTWVHDKTKPLGDILFAQNALSARHRDMLEDLVDEHIRQHDNDPQKSLASVSSVSSVWQSLQQLQDPDIAASLDKILSAGQTDSDPFATKTATVGQVTSGGLRFRI